MSTQVLGATVPTLFGLAHFNSSGYSLQPHHFLLWFPKLSTKIFGVIQGDGLG